MELAGITFDLIIIRIWRGLTTEQNTTFVKSFDRERVTRRDAQGEEADGGSGAASPIVVNLNTVTISVRDKDGP